MAYYDAHRGEPQEFIEVAETPAERGPLHLTVRVRFSASEAEVLQRAAQSEGKTFTEIVRAAVQQYTQPAFAAQEESSAVKHST